MTVSSMWRPSSGFVMCNVYAERPPILSLWDSEGVGWTITVTGQEVSSEELDLAKQLSIKAAEYARECERWAVPPQKQDAPEAAPAV